MFLGVPIPDGEYPHLNDAARIKRVITIAKILGWLILATLVGLSLKLGL